MDVIVENKILVVRGWLYEQSLCNRSKVDNFITHELSGVINVMHGKG